MAHSAGGVVGMPDVACELPAGCAMVEGWIGLLGNDVRDLVIRLDRLVGKLKLVGG